MTKSGGRGGMRARCGHRGNRFCGPRRARPRPGHRAHRGRRYGGELWNCGSTYINAAPQGVENQEIDVNNIIIIQKLKKPTVCTIL